MMWWKNSSTHAFRAFPPTTRGQRLNLRSYKPYKLYGKLPQLKIIMNWIIVKNWTATSRILWYTILRRETWATSYWFVNFIFVNYYLEIPDNEILVRLPMLHVGNACHWLELFDLQYGKYGRAGKTRRDHSILLWRIRSNTQEGWLFGKNSNIVGP